MDRATVTALVESEIMRKINMAKLCEDWAAKGHLDVAEALTEVLNAYKRSPDWTAAKKLVIPFPLPGLNDYIAAERSHRNRAANMKHRTQQKIDLVLRKQIRGPLREPVFMRYTWVEKDRRRDKDNVSALGRKFIQDTLVGMGALRNDGWANIEGFSDRFRVDRRDPRVEVEIVEEQ